MGKDGWLVSKSRVHYADSCAQQRESSRQSGLAQGPDYSIAEVLRKYFSK
jgi:hypothetical protein